jgi:hypothetical protein
MVRVITIIVYGKFRHIIGWVLGALLFVSFGGDEAHAQSLTTPFPSTFRNTRTNELIDGAALAPMFKKIHQHKTVKVMQIGDSHVK